MLPARAPLTDLYLDGGGRPSVRLQHAAPEAGGRAQVQDDVELAVPVRVEVREGAGCGAWEVRAERNDGCLGLELEGSGERRRDVCTERTGADDPPGAVRFS